MVHFTQYGPAGLFYSSSQCMPHGMRVTPFGCPRINGYVLLPGAFRSLSRPSSPCSSIGIRHGPILRLTILFFPRVTLLFRSPHAPFRSSVCLCPLARFPVPSPRPENLIHPRPGIFPFSFSCQISNAEKALLFQTMGQIRVELMTPALSERCSNQLSYGPLYTKTSEKKTDTKTRFKSRSRRMRTPHTLCCYLRSYRRR